MTAQLIDGKALSQQIRNEIQQQVEQRLEQGLSRPGLVVILVGNDPASEVYVRHKHSDCESVGIYSEVIRLPKETHQDELLALIAQLNERADVHGILVQLPLPDHINTDLIIDAIHPQKDVDGFHPYNVGKLVLRKPVMRSCTPKGIMRMLKETGISLSGMDAVIIGQSNIVGRPMAMELLMERCTITVCHSRTKDLEQKCKNADLLVVATGQPKMVPGSWIKPDAIVIDVGINRGDDGKLCGDVDFDAAKEVAGWITPVPGGVGPMTRACLLENTLLAAELLD